MHSADCRFNQSMLHIGVSHDRIIRPVAFNENKGAFKVETIQ